MTSDPPSREEVKQALLDEATDGPNIDRIMVFATIAKTYADGRLIDRETIDRKAMATVMNVDGWTCDGHEPGAWCVDCKRLQLATVDRMLAALGIGGDDDQ
jgi:hypothetical protein